MSDAPDRRGRHCLLCERREPFEPLYEGSGVSIVRCPGCGLVFQNPMPALDSVDDGYYHDEAFTEALFGELREVTLANARHKLELLSASGAIGRGGRALDVGASSGAWLEVAAGAGISATGVELGETTASRARDRGLDVRSGTLASRFDELAAERFDLVSFWDVLEHLPDPLEELRLARRLLAPGGRIAATFPNVEGLYPRLTRRLVTPLTGVWEHPEKPHLYDFSPRTARLLFELAELPAVATSTFATPYGFLRETRLSRQQIGTGPRATMTRIAFAATRALAYPLARMVDRGNAMFIISDPVPGGGEEPPRGVAGTAGTERA